MILCHEFRLVEQDGDYAVVEIKLTSENWSGPIPADLGKRVADVIRESRP